MSGTKDPVREPSPTPVSPPKITTACPPSPFAPTETFASLTQNFKNIQHRPRPKPVLSSPPSQPFPTSSTPAFTPQLIQPPVLRHGDNLAQWTSLAEPYLDSVPENFRKTTLKSLLAPELVYKVDGLAPSPFCSFEEYFGALQQIFLSESSQAAEQQRFFNRTQREALIFTSRPPANVKEALDLDAAQRTQFPLALEPRASRDPNTWGHPPNLPARSTPYQTHFNRPFQPPKSPGPPNNNQCYYCDRFGTAAKKCGHNSGNQPFPLAALYTLPSDFKPYTISGTVANKSVSILIDTGAAVSLIHGSLLQGTNYNQSEFPQLQILTANNSILRLSGSATVPVSIKGKTIQHCFLVSSELKWNVILGCDFLKRHVQAITFSPTSQSLILNDDRVTVDVNSVEIDTRPPLDPSSIEDILPDNISADDRRALYHALVPFSSVFTWADQAIGRSNIIRHRIDTGSAPPQHLPPRRIPFHLREELDKMVENMLQQGIIQPSSSPWAAPVTLVKKDNSLRLCVDYRRLNAVTVKDAFPLPRMDDLLASMAGKKFFATLDLSSSYWQIEVHPEDRAKTAFSLPSGLFEFTTLPMGLANAAATCQRLMQKLLKNLYPSKCLVYLDDVIVWGTTISELLDNLSEVLTRYQEAGLTLNPRKCKFLQTEIRFLGHIVSNEGLRTDPDKIQVVKDWPQPVNGDEVRSFLGLAGYYRAFIPSYARLAFPLTRLTEKSRTFRWTTECGKAFSYLKEALTAAPVLSFPDLSRDAPPFILDTDASSHAIGGVLSQTDSNGREHVIQYGSRTLDKSERNYSATRREMLALVSFTKKFAAFLKGKPFIIRTDHSALEWLQNFHEPEGQVARWQEMLADFDFTVVHRPGKQHLNADALS
ncbi:hypothetical protein SprV_0401699500 [Sparganum proliferum]